ncbi:MAG: hypothetical protein N2595_08890 [bacterium]|nr:hypothetical protein [bacterium]
MKKLINLTPHPITIIPDGGDEITIPASGLTLRLREVVEEAGQINGIPVFAVRWEPEDTLPPEEPDTVYIVSALVKQSAPHRRDFLVPYGTVREVVDGKTVIKGCKGLAF